MSLTHSRHPAEPIPRTRWLIPFLETDPLIDLRLFVLLLPLWWMLGIEQFIWPVLFAVAAGKVLLVQQLRVRVNPPLRWFALFLLTVAFSSLFIVEPERWLTYLRNSGAFVAGFLLVFIIINRARSRRGVALLLNAALMTMLFASIIGGLGAADLWRPSFQSPVGQLLPAAAADTSYGQAIITRVIGEPGWFTGLDEYFRLTSFFLYSTHFASALIYVIPFFFYRLSLEKGFRRLLVGLAIALLSINLLYTTGRVAMISLLVGAVYFLLFQSLRRNRWRVLAALGLGLGLLGGLLVTTVEMTLRDSPQITGRVSETVELLILARGPGSFTSRFDVYEASLEGFVERPLFGWGTERDVEGLSLPAGSHSEYFAVLYRQGLLGVITFTGLLWSVWRCTRPPRGPAAQEPAGALLRYGRWFFVTALINSLMADPVIDTTVYVLLWLLIGLLMATGRLLHLEARDAQLTR